MSSGVGAITGGRRLARNTVLNLAGMAAPMLAALVAIPPLVAGLGTDRFGFLTMAWVVIGYFSLFDLGLGRALTQLVAESLAERRDQEVPSLTWTALCLMSVLGLAGALLLTLLAPWLVGSGLKIPRALQAEAVGALYLLCLSLPFVIGTAGLRGVLEATQSFGLVNALRVPMGLFSYLAPLFVLPFSTSLVPVTGVLVAGRVAAFAAHLAACFHVLPSLRRGFAVQPHRVRRLLRIGGWMTVSNLVSPLMTYLDRFLIAGLLSITAVAYYVTPYEVVTKLWIIPSAMMAVLFPAFASSYAVDRDRTARLFRQGARAIFLIMFPLTLVVVMLAYEGLDLWLGEEFARNSVRVLQWLAVGVFVNCLGQIPYSVLQGIGRPDLTGKLHLAELPFYALAIWLLAGRFGIQGVAVAWVVRVTLDTLVLHLLARHFLPGSAADLRALAGMLLIALAVLGFAAVQVGLALKLALLGGTLVAFALLGWYRILDSDARALVRG